VQKTPQPTAPPSTDGDSVESSSVPFPADHPALPQVEDLGGSVLAKPKVVPIFFSGVSFKAEILDLVAKLGKSAYWKAVTSEYRVGELEALASVDVAETPPAIVADSSIQEWLTARFDGTHPEFGNAPIEGAVYTFYYPASTTIYLGNAPTTDGG